MTKDSLVTTIGGTRARLGKRLARLIFPVAMLKKEAVTFAKLVATLDRKLASSVTLVATLDLKVATSKELVAT